jgi:protein TonB
MERYRALGLSVADPSLPKDAVADVDKMRETLEKVVEQTKVLSKDKTQTSNAMALMEEATNARGSLARDTFDANRWKNETADAREDLANSRSVVINAVSEMPGQPNPSPTPLNNNVAENTPQPTNQNPSQTVFQPISTEKPNVAANNNSDKPVIAEAPKQEVKPVDKTDQVASNNSDKQTSQSTRTRRIETNETPSNQNDKKAETPTVAANTTETPNNNSPLQVGSLVSYATQKANPVYPPAAKSMRMTGVVKVDLVIDENGQVAEVQNTSGPPMLQRAASDAVKKWRFKPFTRGGQATKATGFVSFNFSL